MDSKYTNAYEELKKKREERQKASSQTSDKYKDYADAYAALRGEKKTTSSGNTHGFYAPDAQSHAIPVKQDTAQAALKLMQNRQKTHTSINASSVDGNGAIKTDAREVYKNKGTQPKLGGGKEAQKSGLSYIQSRGQEMFDEAMNAIDKTGKAAVPAVKAFFESLRSESQLQHNPVDATKEKMAQALRYGNVEDARNIEIKPVIELGKNALAAGNKAFNDSLEQQNKKEQKTRELLGKDSDYADTNPAYEKARSNSFTKVLGDLNATTAYMLPAVMMSYATGNPSSLVSSVLSAGTIAAQAYPMAFDEAKEDSVKRYNNAVVHAEFTGKDPATVDPKEYLVSNEQAGNYALREAMNQALGDMLIGGAAGVGSGILDYTVGRYAGKALNKFFCSKPMLKAVSKAASESIGEGAEEVIQSLITTANQRATYNPDAEIDAASVAYEGLLGALMGSVYNVPSIPGRYSVYRSDYDAVNAISKAAASVKTDVDVQKLEQTMDAMTTMCDENIDLLKAEKQTEETKDNISRLEYIRDRVSDVREELEAHKEEIITHNTDMAEALDGVVNGAADNVVENVAELVSVVEEGLEPDENAIDATIDYVVEEIRNKDEEIREAQTPEEKRQAQIGRAVVEKVDETLRENRETIEEFLRRKHDSIDWQGIEESGNAVRRGLETIFTAPKTEQNVPVSEDVAKTTETVDKTAAIPEENSGNDTTEPLQNDSESGTMEKEFSLHHFLHTDTRDGKKLNVFQSTRRLSSEEYQKLKDYMKDVGGYYSRYAKGFIVPDASRIGEIAAFADTDYVSESTAETKEPPAGTPSESVTEEAKEELREEVQEKADEPKSTTQNARTLESAILDGSISKDGITYGSAVRGFSSEQRQYFVESLIDGLKTEKETIHTDIPYDGTFEIRNDPYTVANLLDALHIKVKEEPFVQKTISLLKNAQRIVLVEHGGSQYITDGAVLLAVSPKQLSDISNGLKLNGKNIEFSEHDLIPALGLEHMEPVLKLPFRSYKKGNDPETVSFETEEGYEVLAYKKYVRFFDGKDNVWQIARRNNIRNIPALYAEGTKYIVISTDTEGNLKGAIMPVAYKNGELETFKQSAFKSTSKLAKNKKETAEAADNTEVSTAFASAENGVDSLPDSKTLESVRSDTSIEESGENVNTTPAGKISDFVLDGLTAHRNITTQELQAAANDAYGGTMAEGAYDVKAMTDALELGVNMYILDLVGKNQGDFNTNNPNDAVESIKEIDEDILSKIPTQTKRTEEQINLQQFSTPPNIAYLASWVANIDGTDTVLEPSAGIGGLASFAKADGATVYVNELSDSRLAMLKELPFDGFYQENAEQIDNILPESVSPTVVLMNPPFSSTGGRTKNTTKNAIPHIEQALARLQDGGRLVAIVGKGMANDTPTFRGWYDTLRKNYSIRANIGINGENYRKYGTTFDVQLLVIDKTGAQTGETITGNYDDLKQIPELLKGVRNDRNRTDQQYTAGTGSEADYGTGVHDTGAETNLADTVSERDSGNGTDKRMGRSDSGKRRTSGSDSVSGEQSGTVQGTDTAERNGTDGGGLDSGISGNPGETGSISERESASSTGEVGVRGSVGESDVRERMESGGRTSWGDDGQPLVKKKPAAKKAAEQDDGVYATYRPAALTVKGAKKHPAILVESSAMSAVSSPELHYVPKLDQKLIDDGALSDAQLENISYAGQAHEQVLKNGARKGYFIGDGTGVGKGRQLAGIILDNFNQGRTKAVWVSEKKTLFEDAVRDWTDLGGDPAKVFDYSKDSVKKNISGISDGILFVTYDTLKGGTQSKGGKQGVKHLDTIKNWLGEGFDGVIVFDEAHNMANLKPTKKKFGAGKPSEKAIAGNKFQEEVPDARIVYASATGATNIENLAYAQRLGLWGEGTNFVNEEDFISKIGRAGIAAMELVARDMKAMGVYLARSISYDGVVYDQLQHKLSKDQQYMYDTMSKGWQVVLQNFDKAMVLTDSTNSSQVKRARGQIYGNMQQFYNQVLSSMAMPSVIKDIEKELEAGHSCVIQLVNTNESAQDTAVSESKAKGETDLDNLDITPRQLITGYVNNAFPVQQYEEYLDEQGNKQSRPVVDSAGNPVLNRQAVKMRDALIAQINEISIPEGPLDMLINHFGADQVAEITGRSSRVVNKEDENGNIRKELEKRNSTKANIAETRDFQDGKKRILVFSSAGSTGRSYHADKRAKNQQKRIHYVLQPGWQADKAVQGFGRTHRSNQVDTPVFKLVSTDVMGHKRFVTSIARRLDQLGALTKGQRQTGSGVFGEKDNLESPLSSEALREFYKKMGNGQLSGIDPESTLKKLGLYEKFYDEYGRFKLNETVASDIPQFLNRILGLEVEEQNAVFTAFENIRQAYYDAAIEAGTLDMGMENVKADKIEIGQEETVYTDESTGAETKYIRALVYNKPSVIESVEDARVYSPNFVDIRRMEDGSVRAVYRIADQTDNFGRVSKRYRLQSPNTAVSNTMNERNLESKTEKIPEKEWESSWKEAVHDVPEYNENEVHMITGALLPIWNRLPSDGTTKARRITTADGSQYLGRIIPPKQIDAVLRSFDVKGDNKVYTGNEIYDAVMKKTQTVVFNGQYGGTLTVSRRRVSGENRMEVTGGNLFALKQKYPDMITENIQFQNRYFIPSGEKGVAILSDMIDTLKVRSIGKDSDGDIYYKRKSAKETVREGKEYRADTPPSLDDLKITAEKMFHLPINYGKTGGKAGLYKTKEDTIRVAQAGDFLTIAHEIGHRLDNRYNLHSLPEVSELRSAFYEALEAEGYEEFQMPYEMVSEYFRSYLENAEETRKQFPKFTDAAFSILDSRDTDNIARISEMSNAYYDSETGKRAQAAVHNRAQENAPLHKFGVSLKEARYDPKGFIGETGKQLWDVFMINVFDDLYALKHFGSTYDMAMRERQANSVIRGWLNGNATDKYGEVLGSGITGRLSEFGVTPSNRNAFDSYLVDLAALDHMKQEKENPSGRPMGGRVYGDDRVQATVEKRIIEVESKYPGFHEAAQELFRYDDLLLSRAAQSGIISEETIKQWKEKYPHYSPLYRVMDDKTKIGGKARSRYTDQNNVFKAFKGSGRDIYSPVENRMIQTENVVKAAMRNDVALAFFDYVDANDNMGVFAEKIPQSMYKDIIGLFPAYKKLQNFDFKSLEKLSDAERQNLLDEVQEAMGNVAESWKPRQFQGKNVVAVMRNGKPVFYEIHDKAVLDALTSLSTPEMNIVGVVFNEVTKTFKVLTTGASPFFATPNFVRDTQSGYISSTTTANPVKYITDLFVAIGDIIRKTESYQRFMDAGGGYEGSLTRNMKTLRSVEWDMVPHSTIERILHVPTRIWNAFARMVDIGESAQRLAEFKRAEKAGMDCLEAMRAQQEITVNFSRHGKITKHIDPFVPYFNASLQSFYHLFEVLGKNKDSKAKKQAWAKFITMNLTMSILQQAFKIIGSAITGEDQEEEYNKLSGYIKNAYWCIPQGNGKFIRIPKQKDFMLLSTMLDRVVEFSYDENPRAFYEFTDYLSGVLMPPHSLEDVTIFGTAYALAKNETFTGAPIVSTAYQNLIPEEQFNENTSAVAKSIGALLNQSPMRIQFIMDDTTGFVGQFIEYAGNILTSIGEDGLLSGGKTAFDEFTSTFRTDNTYSTDEISYFYDTKEGYDARAATYKLRGNGNGYDFYDVYGAYKYGKIADVYSKCNRLIKADGDEESSRETRRLVNAFVKSVNDTMVSDMDEEVAAIAEAAGFAVSDIAPYIVTPDQITHRENNKSYYVELTAADMLEYYTETAILFELNYPSILQEDGTATEKAAALESIRDDINSYMREQWFRKLMERDGVKTK